jgi:hypothetical protein
LAFLFHLKCKAESCSAYWQISNSSPQSRRGRKDNDFSFIREDAVRIVIESEEYARISFFSFPAFLRKAEKDNPLRSLRLCGELLRRLNWKKSVIRLRIADFMFFMENNSAIGF